jgi:acetolactate synthase I/II/III large subunit
LLREVGAWGGVVPVDVGSGAYVPTALARLAETAGDAPPVDRDWSSAHRTYLDSSEPRPATGIPLDPEGVMHEIAAAFPSDTIVANDAGNFSVYAHRFWRFRHPRCQLGPTSGAMGYGIPAGVAAAHAEPGREVLVLVGDGGFLMTGHELETAVRCGVDLTVVVFRNGLYGTIALHQARSVGRLSAVSIGDVDIAAAAGACGAASWRAEKPDELGPALTEARAHHGPAVVDVLVDPDALVPSTRLSDLLDHREEGLP